MYNKTAQRFLKTVFTFCSYFFAAHILTRQSIVFWCGPPGLDLRNRYSFKLTATLRSNMTDIIFMGP